MFMQMRMKAPTWCLEGKGIGIRGQAQGIAGKQNRGFFHFEKVHKQKKPFFSKTEEHFSHDLGVIKFE